MSCFGGTQSTRPQVFKIELDSTPRGSVYQPGDVVAGKLIVRHPSVIRKVGNITVEIHGFGFIKWTKRKLSMASKPSTEVEVFEERTDFIKQETELLPQLKDNVRLITQDITSGDHFYPFRFLLPANCAQSTKGKTYEVTYQLKATMAMPSRKEPITSFVFLDVRRPYNCLTHPDSAVPIVVEDSTTFLLKGAGKLSATLKLRRTGWYTGDTLEPELTIANNSTTALSQVTLSLVKQVELTATSKNSRSVEELKKETILKVPGDRSVGGATTETVLFPDFTIPNDAASDDGGWENIRINYAIVAKIVPEGAHQSLILKHKIIIGIHDTMNESPQTSPACGKASQAIRRQAPSAPVLGEEPPPSYDSVASSSGQ